MTRAKCCACNGPTAVCRSCRCAKNNTACISCYPSRKGRCENFNLRSSPNNIPVFDTSNQASADDSNNVHSSYLHLHDENNLASNTVSEDILSFRRGSVLDFVPKGSRILAARSLSNIINNVCDTNSPDDWRKLVRFSPLCFKKPKRGGKKQPSLATLVKRQIEAFLEDPFCPLDSSPGVTKRNANKHKARDDDIRAKLVGKKLANFDIKGAVRILSSDDRILPFDETTLSQLESKHPAPHRDSDFPNPPSREEGEVALQLTEQQVQKAIHSFPGGQQGVAISSYRNTSKT